MINLDHLPAGTPIAGWGGTAAHDHNGLGLLDIGPQPAVPWLYRLLAVGMAQRAVLGADGALVPQQEPLPPHLAVILTRAALVDAKIRQMLRRARVGQVVSRPQRRRARLLAKSRPRAILSQGTATSG